MGEGFRRRHRGRDRLAIEGARESVEGVWQRRKLQESMRAGFDVLNRGIYLR